MSKVTSLPNNPDTVLMNKMIDAILENKACQELAHLKRIASIQEDTIKIMQGNIDAERATIKIQQKKITDQANEILRLKESTTAPAVAQPTVSEDELWFDDETPPASPTSYEFKMLDRRVDNIAKYVLMFMALCIVQLIGTAFVIYNLS